MELNMYQPLETVVLFEPLARNSLIVHISGDSFLYFMTSARSIVDMKEEGDLS